MSQQAVDKIEQRFQEIGLRTDKSVWDNGEKLIQLSNEVEKNDIYLARRIIQRARNLEPNNENINKTLNRLSAEIASKAKMTQISSSTESPRVPVTSMLSRDQPLTSIDPAVL